VLVLWWARAEQVADYGVVIDATDGAGSANRANGANGADGTDRANQGDIADA
jgi:hypothetical protein